MKYLFYTLTVLFLFLNCAGNKPPVTVRTEPPVEPDPKAVQLFTEGISFEMDQKYAKALLAFQEALLYDPGSADILAAIGRVYDQMGKEESAMLILRQALLRDPGQIESAERLARIYASQNWWDLVEKTYQQILSHDSNHQDAYYHLALLYLRQNRLTQAAQMYEALLQLQQEPDPQILIGLGSIYLNAKAYDKADTVYTRLTQIYPQEGMGYLGLGRSADARGDSAQALMYYKKAYQYSPEVRQIQERLLRFYLLRKQYDDAIGIYHDAIRRDSSDVVPWLEMADLYREMDDSAAVLKVYQTILDQFPEDWRGPLNLGRFYMDQQNYTLAIEAFQKTINLEPNNFWGWVFSGISRVHMQKSKEAVPFLEKALTIVPDDPLGNYYLGSVYAELGQNERALAPLQMALKDRPDWISAITTLANVYENKKAFTRSDSLYQRALKLEPDNALILNNYGYSLSLRGERLADALKMAQKALSIDPENGAYLDTVGWIYFHLENYTQARYYIEKAHHSRPESVEVMEHLGDVYYQMGLLDLAREIWAKALELDQDNVNLQQRLNMRVVE